MKKRYNRKIKRYLKMDFDKFLHFIGGIAIVAFFAVFGLAYIGLGTTILIGFLKEYIWDYSLKRGTIEAKDFIATVCGGAIVYLAILHPIIILSVIIGYFVILSEEKKN